MIGMPTKNRKRGRHEVLTAENGQPGFPGFAFGLVEHRFGMNRWRSGILQVARESQSPAKREINEADAEKHLRTAIGLQQSRCEQFPESKLDQVWLGWMRDNLADCLRQSKQLDAALSLIEQSIDESAMIATSERGGVPAIHVLIAQYETKTDILSDLERHKDAGAARHEARKLRKHLPPPHQHKRHR